MNSVKGSYESFNVVHGTDILVRASYKEKFQGETSGIIITIAPSVVEDRPTSGVVVKKGNDTDEIPMGVKAHFGKTAGYDLYFNDNKEEWYILLDKESIIGYETISES